MARKIRGANIDIYLTSDQQEIQWKQDKCPWNKKEKTNTHKCAIKNKSLCKYFRGINYPGIVVCDYP